MFRPMRRLGQQLEREACEEILRTASSGVLSVLGDDGYPYGVPLSHFYADGKLYFHCAREGHKADAVRACSKASFCVVAKDDVIPERFTTHFRSVIAFGQVRLLEDAEEKRQVMVRLTDKFSPGREAARDEEIAQSLHHLCVMELTIQHLTGKQAAGLLPR